MKKVKLTEDAQISVKQLAPGKAKRVLSEGNTYEYKVPVVEETTEETDETTDTTEGTGTAQ